ncbi:hypothetical protein PMG71_11215 [Roseofilum sp. BLCC_M154]|uniref:Peptidase C39-like domain-containing protein n=1 Tax=Roseofilum acuticapitatum BLCC-M154 TaxID=3022444 RepID=A0ABT7ASW3_9CYAN|nr:hypothetical protein [Roseofilum acuticapitatum]MDJ1169996.1 hypothetical protein [Roseofilum acuticapitatum BLCC-M154]
MNTYPDDSSQSSQLDTHHDTTPDSSPDYHPTLPDTSTPEPYPHQWQPHSWDYTTTSLHSDPTSRSNPDPYSTYNEQTDHWNHQHYDSNQDQSWVVGHPAEEMNYWHQQQNDYSCGIAAQQSAIEHLTHHHYSEAQLSHYAEQRGWYDSAHGTPSEDFGKLLADQAHVPVESHVGANLTEISTKLKQGEEVFVGVSSTVEWLPEIIDPHLLAGQPADHIVQVISVKIDPHTLQPTHVIVNDSGSPEGRGVEIPVEQFQVAMDTSHDYMASTSHNQPSWFTSHLGNTESMTFGCKITYWDYDHRVSLDGSKVGTYNGNTFYWNSGNLAGNWNCNNHHAYTANGQDLGYAKTWSDAALLIYKQS